MSNTKTGRIFLSPPSVGAKERAAVKRAFDSGYVAPCGPQVDEFERRLAALAGRRYAVAVSSGTAAIDLVMAELGVDSSWTVIAPTLTFIATVGPAFHRGAKLVFVDCDATGNIDVALLEEALESYRVDVGSHRVKVGSHRVDVGSHRVKVGSYRGDVGSHRVKVGSCRGYNQTLIDPNPTLIDPNPTLIDSNLTLNHPKTLVIGVDLYGACCDYGAISKLCRRYGAIFVDDAAEAVGATWKGKSAGSAGLAGIYSFNGNKIVTTSGGGAIVTDDRGLAERAKKRAQQSREKCAWYEHREVGYNYRLSNILGALGIAQLDRLPAILEKRRANFEWYAKNFPGDVMVPPEGSNHWLTVGLLPSRRERDAMSRALAAADIESRPVWKPMHLQPVFAGCRVFGGEVAETLFERGICLPSGTDLTAADFRRIAGALR
ncbi:MAG: DegT/DnrJ/EryC1/StrS family aminotransferase [Kiritimatiellae bacterium]|nr:DegT/DnrJ/EryC1/StrS family aminotransferase [Kiritimatiellia bacterium]